MATKQELLEEAKARGLDVTAANSKAEIEAALGSGDALEDANGGEEDPQPLEGTPVVAVDESAPLGEVGDDAPAEEPTPEDEGDAVDDTDPLLDATPSETEVHDTTVGSTRPEDGFVAA